ncbi:MAG TPA: hypothetical protein VGI33_18410 [Paenibacillus sp.]|jgi:DNA integrity scanning protein DisA with diadenylate cyclase activity
MTTIKTTINAEKIIISGETYISMKHEIASLNEKLNQAQSSLEKYKLILNNNNVL